MSFLYNALVGTVQQNIYFLGEISGTSSTHQHNPSEVIEKLCDRLVNATLLEDRRAAILGLKGLSKQYQVEVGTKAMQILLHILHSFANSEEDIDAETVKAILETLLHVCENHPNSKEENGTLFTEILLKDPSNGSVLLEFLKEQDFHLRFTCIELLKILLKNKRKSFQDCVLTSPMGVSRLMDLLDDRREVIRNEGLLLLIDLTFQNPDIQKIITFENAFERLFSIIHEEGGPNGDVIVQDCIQLIQNLLGDNVSNQNYFRESGLVGQIALFFSAQKTKADTIKLADLEQEHPFVDQKVQNISCMLDVLVQFLSADKASQNTKVLNQQTVFQNGIFYSFLAIGLNKNYPSPLIAIKAIYCCSLTMIENEVVREHFGKMGVIDSNNVKRPLLEHLLRNLNSIPSNESNILLKQSLFLLINSFLFKNHQIQKFILSTISNRTPDLNPNDVNSKPLSSGEMILEAVSGNNVDADSFLLYSLIISLILRQQPVKARDGLLDLRIEPNDDASESLFHAIITNLMSAYKSKQDFKNQLGYMIILISWMYQSTKTVEYFLNERTFFSFLIELISNISINFSLQGLAAVAIGICFESNCYSESTADKTLLTRDNIQSILINRIGSDQFLSKLSKLKDQKEFLADYSIENTVGSVGHKTTFEKQSFFLDRDLVQFIKGLADSFAKTVVNPQALKEIKNAKSEEKIQENVINSYKVIIADQDKEIGDLKRKLAELNLSLTSSPKKLSADDSLQEEKDFKNVETTTSPFQSQSMLQVDDSKLNELSEALKVAKEENSNLLSQIEILKSEISKSKSECEKAQKDRDDALVFLAEQDVEMTQLKELLKSLGHPVEESDIDDDLLGDGEEEVNDTLLKGEQEI